jgi:hypothetical protein
MPLSRRRVSRRSSISWFLMMLLLRCEQLKFSSRRLGGLQKYPQLRHAFKNLYLENL